MTGLRANGLSRDYLAVGWRMTAEPSSISRNRGTQVHLADCAWAQEQSWARAPEAARNSFDRGDLGQRASGQLCNSFRRIANEIRGVAGQDADARCRESGKALGAAEVRYGEEHGKSDRI